LGDQTLGNLTVYRNTVLYRALTHLLPISSRLTGIGVHLWLEYAPGRQLIDSKKIRIHSNTS